MKNTSFKKPIISILFILLLFFGASLVYSLPGIKTLFPPTAGQYVYYRDYSFENETYIGFLQYSDETIAIRYYTPKPQQGSSELVLYISLDSSSDFINMTGEKVATQTVSSDVETLNYLHDLLYEFASRRKKINDNDFSSTLRISSTFDQFGGDVIMTYDFYIPLFNLNRIIASDTTVLFELITQGTIQSSEDKSFHEFTGIPFNNSLKNTKKDSKKNLDSSWSQLMENFWAIGDNAILMNSQMLINPEIYESQGFSVFQYFTCVFISSLNSAYVYMPETSIITSNKKLYVKTLVYDSTANTFSYDIKQLIKSTNNIYIVGELTAFESFYLSNQQYLNKVLEKF